MVCSGKAYNFWYALTGLWLIALCGVPVQTHGAMLDDLCSPDTNGAYEISLLAEEAEATGMPPRLLRRLLAKGYRNQASAKELGQLLCLFSAASKNKGVPSFEADHFALVAGVVNQ